MIASVPGRAAAAVLFVCTLACGPSSSSAGEHTASSASSGSETPSSSSSGTAGVEGWPERWYGQYYEATYIRSDGEEVDIELGVESPSSYAFHYFHNVRLEPGVVRLDYFESTGDEERAGSSLLAHEIDASSLVIRPDEGRDHIDWPPASAGRAGAEIHPGADCSELALAMTFTATDDRFVTTLRRGRLCLVVPCDPNDGIQCTVTVDLCPDDPAPTTCDPE